MASIWKHPNSPFWSACFNVHTSADVLRWKRSLKSADRKLATRIADALEDAGRGVMDERAIASFVEKIQDMRARRATQDAFADLFKVVTGREMGAGSLRAFAAAWLNTIEPQIAPTSYLKYKRAIAEFLMVVGEAGDRELVGFGSRDDGLVLRFRDQLHARLAPASVNDSLKIVRQMFKAASERFKIENPAALVRGVKRNPDTADRRAFTLPEIGRILRAVKGSEWEGIVLFGIYTGQRLGDIVRLRWENVDLIRGELALTSRKTRRRILVPLAGALSDHLIALSAPDTPMAFVFPKAADCLVRAKSGTAGALSNQFHDVLARAGLVLRRSHRKAKDGAGRSARRRASEVSFHSFRHTATSLLKNAGVAQSVVMDIIGHESKAVSQIYTHVGDAEKRLAVAALPSLSAFVESTAKRQLASKRPEKSSSGLGSKPSRAKKSKS